LKNIINNSRRMSSTIAKIRSKVERVLPIPYYSPVKTDVYPLPFKEKIKKAAVAPFKNAAKKALNRALIPQQLTEKEKKRAIEKSFPCLKVSNGMEKKICDDARLLEKLIVEGNTEKLELLLEKKFSNIDINNPKQYSNWIHELVRHSDKDKALFYDI